MRLKRRLAGFTLVEVLVALTILLAFGAAIGPMLFQSRRTLSQGAGAVSADLLLRSLINTPFDRSVAGSRYLDGETGGFSWRVSIEPRHLEIPDIQPQFVAAKSPGAEKTDEQKPGERKNWATYRVVAQVFWGHGQSASAETLRLGKAESE